VASHLFGRSAHALPRAVAGDGCYLIDAEGRRYLDGSGGAAVSCLGHSDTKVRQAMHDQIDRLNFAHTGFFTSDPAEDLARALIAHAPPGLSRVYPLSGGSEAVEAALKLARQYFLETGQPQRTKIVARRQSYHGNTLGALAAGGNAWRREKFAPLLVTCHHIAPCYPYRDRADGESLDAYGLRAADALEDELQRLGPETVMAFIAEPVVGATAGALAPPASYFPRIRDICDRHGVLLILDEVMCGMGRTGTLFACDQDGVAPDIVTIAKGLGAGYVPIGAMLASDAIYRAIADGSGAFQHGHTYHGHPLAGATAVAVLDRLTQDGLVAEVPAKGQTLVEALTDRLENHPHVGDIRGRGLFRGIELVADRDTKAPFDPARKLHARIKAEAFARGLICYPGGGTIDGVHGDHILLAPPFIIDDAQIGWLVDTLADSLDASIAA